MGSLSDKLEYLLTTKEQIKQALTIKNIDIDNNTTFRNYAVKTLETTSLVDTRDANAVASDILQGKTAYVNGVKLVGNYNGSNGGGKGDVKLFRTIENMQSDSDATAGDLAIVYSNQQSNLTENATFSKVKLPKTVVLTEAIDDWLEIGFQPVDTTIDMDCWGNLDSNGMNCTIFLMTEGTEYRIRYESQDGITYTRNDDTPEEIDFGFDVKFGTRWGEARWDDRIGQFFIIGQVTYNGLFEYSDRVGSDHIVPIDLQNLERESTASGYNIKVVYDTNTLVSISDLQKAFNKLREIFSQRDYVNATVTSDGTDIYMYLMYDSEDDVLFEFGETFVMYENNKVYLPFRINGIVQPITNIYRYKYTIATSSLERLSVSEDLYIKLSENHTYPAYELTERYLLGLFTLDKSYNYEISVGSYGSIIYLENENGIHKITGSYSYRAEYANEQLYLPAKTQLTTRSAYVYKGDFYGINGVQTGTLMDMNTREEIYTGIDIWNKYSDLILPVNSANLFFNKSYDRLPNIICTNNTVNLSGLFRMFTLNDSLNLINWDTSNVINMCSMFYYTNCNLLGVDFSNWNVSNVTDMSGMFWGANCNLLDVDFSNWNVSNVTDMSGMFRDHTVGNISNWNVSNVTNMCIMLENAIGNSDFSNWDTSNVKNMNELFLNYTGPLNSIANWDTSNVTSMTYLFAATNVLADINFASTLGKWNTINLQNASYMFHNRSNISIINLANANMTKLVDMSYMFYNCRNLHDIYVNTWSVSNVKELRYTFYNCQSLTTLNTTNWCLQGLRNADHVFSNCYNLRNLDIANWNMSSVNNTFRMFYGCRNLRKLDVSNWEISTIQSTGGMFYWCENLTSIDVSNWDVSNIIYMANMFSSCFNLTSIDVSNWNTSAALNIAGMFAQCGRLRNIDVSNWNVSNVVYAVRMFFCCNNLTSIDVSNWNTSKMMDISGMFSTCYNLTSIDVSNWNTSAAQDIAGMFSSCWNLTSIDVSKWNINKASSASSTFLGCANLRSIDVSNWNTSNITNLSATFSECYNLQNLNVSNWNISKVSDIYKMFSKCNNLSDASIDSIINMFLTANTSKLTMRNLSNSNTSGPFAETNISNTRYQSRWGELTAAGWTY